jgi:hypothetical protein
VGQQGASTLEDDRLDAKVGLLEQAQRFGGGIRRTVVDRRGNGQRHRDFIERLGRGGEESGGAERGEDGAGARRLAEQHHGLLRIAIGGVLWNQ